MKRVFLFRMEVKDRHMAWGICPLIPHVTQMDEASLERYEKASALIYATIGKPQRFERTRESNELRYELAAKALEILELQFPHDDIEFIDEATCRRRLLSGQYERLDQDVIFC